MGHNTALVHKYSPSTEKFARNKRLPRLACIPDTPHKRTDLGHLTHSKRVRPFLSSAHNLHGSVQSPLHSSTGPGSSLSVLHHVRRIQQQTLGRSNKLLLYFPSEFCTTNLQSLEPLAELRDPWPAYLEHDDTSESIRPNDTIHLSHISRLRPTHLQIRTKYWSGGYILYGCCDPAPHLRALGGS